MSHEYQNESIVITDTSCFILLDKIDALFILDALYTAIVTTPQIAKEFGKKLPDWIIINRFLTRPYYRNIQKRLILAKRVL